MTELASSPIGVPSYVVLAVLAVIVGLLAVVATLACVVVAKARPQDLTHVLQGLGQVLEALSLFLPWGHRARAGSKDPADRRRTGRR